MANQMGVALQSMQKLHARLNNRGGLTSHQIKQNKIDKLRTNMINAKNKMQNSPNEFDRAERAYLLEAKGSDYYSSIQRDKYKKEARIQVYSWNKEMINNMFTNITNSIKYYKSQQYYAGNVDKVYKSYNSDLDNLKKQIYDTDQANNINERLGQFYYNNTETVDWWTYILKVIYYVLIAISILTFIVKKQFRNAYIYVFLFTIILMPYALDKYYAFIMRTFKHIKLDNVYFIFIITMLSVIYILNYTSKLPFTSTYI